MAATKRKIDALVSNGIESKKSRVSNHNTPKLPSPEESSAASSEDELDISSSDTGESMDELEDGPDGDVYHSEEEEAENNAHDDTDDNKTNFEPKQRKPLALDPHKEAASREAHLKQKEKLLERKSAKPHADKLARSKSLWAQINRKKVPKAERQKYIEELFGLISGSVVDIIFKHDASRVVQACFKFGNEAQRTQILQELKGRLVDLSKSTYGKFLVVKMLYYGTPKHRDAILSEIHGNVRKLIKHKEAAYVVEDAFRDYTTPTQQDALVSEMYGAEFSVFENTDKRPLAQLLKDSPEKRDTVMKNLWDSIQDSIKKGSIGFTILHRALLSFLHSANGPEKAEAVELVKDSLPEVVHTRDGSEVACIIIAISAAKDRKAIMKSFREHIVKAMTDEYGWMSVVALFMCVDDTVLLTKAFGPNISKKCVDLFEDRFARKVFLYLLGGLQTRYFTSREMQVFAEVDSLKQMTSKKDDLLRRQEILAALLETLVATLTENVDSMFNDPNASSLLVEILFNAQKPSREAAMNTLVNKFDGRPVDSFLEHTPRVLKTLVQGGFYDKSTKTILAIDPPLDFAERLAPTVTSNAEQWACGDGSFVVVALLESLKPDSTALLDLKKALSAVSARVEEAAKKDNRGSKIILLRL